MFGLSVNLVTITFVISGLCYVVVNYVFNYWKRRGVFQIEPSFPFGNIGDIFKQKVATGEAFANLYRKTKENAVLGIYLSLRPALLINDPELAKNIMVKDFQYFHDRGLHVNEEKDPLSGHLFSLSGDKWKNLRAKLTPTFTSGKLKAMFQTLLDCGIVLENFMEKHAQNEDTVEIRDIFARYNTDIIASVAFGIQIDSINDPNAVFRTMGLKVFSTSVRNAARGIFTFLMPAVTKFLQLKSVDDDVEDFMIGVVRDTMDYREKNNVTRKDFMQLMLQLRNSGTVSIDEKWDVVSTEDSKKKLTLNEVAAQAHIFFVAGFETSSTTMSFCLYELCKNPDILRKVQAEIDEVLKRFDNKITYDSIMEMKYLENCIDETLRKYPPLPILNRVCSKPYKIPNMNFTIEKGTAIILPILGLQKDEQYYPNPEEFIPERFDDEAIKNMPYAPFGNGPRICIGLRMGKMLTKVGLTLMLSKFNFELGAQTPRHLEMSPRILILTPVTGIHLKVSKR